MPKVIPISVTTDRSRWRQVCLVAIVAALLFAPQDAEACDPVTHGCCFQTANATVQHPFTLVESASQAFLVANVTTISKPKCDDRAPILDPTDTSLCMGGGGLMGQLECKCPDPSCEPPSLPLNYMCSDVTGGMVTVTGDCAGVSFSATGVVQPVNHQPPNSAKHQQLVFVNVDLAGLPSGTCTFEAFADVDFSANDVVMSPVTARTPLGDGTFSTVEEISPGVARLDMRMGNLSPPRCASGWQRRTTVEVTNNDPTHSVDLMFTASSHQNGNLPTTTGGPEADGISSISANEHDDNVIAFEEDCPPSGILPLPSDVMHHTQRDISKPVTIAPGATEEIAIINKSHPMCLDGSCFQFNFDAAGQFANGDPADCGLSGMLNNDGEGDCPDAEFPVTCCKSGGTVCENLLPVDCIAQGGVPGAAYSECQGDVSLVNGIDDGCELDPADRTVSIQACCPTSVAPLQPECSELQPLRCAAEGGTPQNPGSNCGTTTCPAFMWCCFDDGECQILLNGVCESTGGDVHTPATLPSKTNVTWAPVPSALSYNIYRGDIPGLPDNADCMNGSDPDLTDTLFVDTDVPGLGGTFYYLITFNDASGESSLGSSSTGQARTAAIPCP